MKKFLSLLFSLLIIISLAGCSKQPKTDKENHEHETNYVTNSNGDTTTPGEIWEKGAIDGNVYTNSFLNLTFTKPNSWEFLPEEAVKIQGDEYDMMVVDHKTNGSVYLAFENVKATSGAAMTAKEYVSRVLQAALEYSPYSTFMDQTEVKIGGNTYIKVTIVVQDQNDPLTKYVYLRSVGDYMAQIYATIPTANADAVDFDSMLS
ncbi:MAG: hypothetical protein E7566_01525 [Ruminococcaceae bacterium]|nr:hypothetical protein [Oscillospiraceae bacterium]